MQPSKHIVLIAGEESGDVHAAALVRQLKQNYPNLRFSGIGGRHMQQEGVELLSDLARHGVTGATEVIRLFRIIRKAFSDIKRHLTETKPDLLILVDYPGFNLRLAKFAKERLQLKVLYYISPQIWAWKANRIHHIKRYVDTMAVILPFEKALYQHAGVPVHFVGHPLVEKIPSNPNVQTYRSQLHLPQDAQCIAMLPGSRKNEIAQHMPVLRDTAVLVHQQNPSYHFVIPIAGTLDPDLIKGYFTGLNLPISFIEGNALECMAAADFVVVASGTASLECALLEKPMCIIYKTSMLTYYLAMKWIKVRFLGLCNLLSNRFIVPEFLQYDCNAVELARYISDFAEDSAQPYRMKRQLAEVKESLSSNKSDCSLFELVASELTEKNA